MLCTIQECALVSSLVALSRPQVTLNGGTVPASRNAGTQRRPVADLIHLLMTLDVVRLPTAEPEPEKPIQTLEITSPFINYKVSPVPIPVET